MAQRKVVTGTGITKRERVSFQAPFTGEDQKALKASFQEMDRRNNLDDVLGDIEAIAVAVLTDAGLPAEYKFYELPGGGAWGLTHLIKARNIEPDSPEGYAARIIDEIAFVKEGSEPG